MTTENNNPNPPDPLLFPAINSRGYRVDKLSPPVLKKLFHDYVLQVLYSAPKDNNGRVSPEHQEQALAVAGVETRVPFSELCEVLGDQFNVSERSFYRARSIWRNRHNPTLTYDIFFRKSGRPKTYTSEVDAAFVDWLHDINTAVLCKLMGRMIAKYRQLHRSFLGYEVSVKLSREGVRRRINSLLRENHMVMRLPKVVEAKRNVRFETVNLWFNDLYVIKALSSVHPMFLYNADETQINRKGGAPGKVATEEGTQLTLPVEDRTGSHVTLFPVISAEGEVMTPYVVLHGGPHAYIHCEDRLPQIKLVETGNGYMDKKAFRLIMKEYFIPGVQKKREWLDSVCYSLTMKLLSGEGTKHDYSLLQKYSKISKHAVLVVDGHKSRYDAEALRLLGEADIDLVVMPAHTSHFLQPLDLRLNGIVKQFFGVEYTEELSDTLVATIPQSKRKRKGTAEPDEEDIAHAEYERLHVLNAIRNAVPRALTPDNIESAWRTSHLCPFVQDPPYSKEKEESFRREIKASLLKVRIYPIEAPDGKTTGVVNKDVSITGVINSAERLPQMEELLSQLDVEPQPCDGESDFLTSEGSLTALIQLPTDDDDVGDTVHFVAGTEGGPDRLVGYSDAACYVTVREEDLK